MLDKSIEFHSIIMKNKNNVWPRIPDAPEGYSIRFYKPGDEKDWAKIQTVVGEFENEEQAIECYKGYLLMPDELRKRQLFVIDNSSQKPVATATAWHSELNGKQIGVVHALSCLPEYQSVGIGKVVAAYMMKCYYELMGGKEVWLDTQTWSYKAIGIYMDLGFVPQKTAVYNDVPNEYELACKAMKNKMRRDVYERFISTAE